MSTESSVSMIPSTVDKIIDTAERRIRSGGYNSFSFRDISKDIGIKSASIHYHFPTKSDLGVAIANRYTQRFSEKLDAILLESPDVSGRLSLYIGLFRNALEEDNKMCLCGQFASEYDVLPEPIQHENRRFFELNINWLTTNIFGESNVGRATTLLAGLEGGMIISKAMNSHEYFNRVAQEFE